MKRSLSESDQEDDFDDDLKNGSPSQSCQITDRKKRRGVIEKRRRDRINNSLSELRRLVPTAFEKQGSAKLEKAEILQMTVDHLKMLHQKGINGYNYQETHAVAMDYRGIGFRECASEVARYLVAVEGMDLQDPLRLRLLGHLQCFSSQRDVATKSTNLHNSTWNPMQPQPGLSAQYCGNGISSVGNMFTSQHTGQSEHMSMTSHTTHAGVATVSFSESNRLNPTDNTPSLHGHARMVNPSSLSGHTPISMNSQNGQQVSPSLIPTIPQLSSQFPMALPVSSMMSPNGSPYHNSSVKPYRPWGAEIVY